MEDLQRIEDNWGTLGRDDPMWAAMSLGGHEGDEWSVEEFLASGEGEIGRALKLAEVTTADLPRNAALDFGCGPGRLSYGLVKAGFAEVLGIDVAEPMVEVARSTGFRACAASCITPAPTWACYRTAQCHLSTRRACSSTCRRSWLLATWPSLSAC